MTHARTPINVNVRHAWTRTVLSGAVLATVIGSIVVAQSTNEKYAPPAVSALPPSNMTLDLQRTALVINWLTGFDDKQLQKHIDDKVTFEEFFQHATLNPNAHLITGVICGYRVEEIENSLTQHVAAAAIMELSRTPKNGESTPAATCMPAVL